MSAWDLPTSLEINGAEYPIETDFRAILNILTMFSDPEFEADEKWMACMELLFGDMQAVPYSDWEEAIQKIIDFIDMGIKGEERGPRTMDWEQDAPIIIPAINRVVGKEVRSLPYMHWWTFLGAYMEIGESLFSSVLNIRQKRAKGKKLEQYEKDFYRENRKLIDLRKKMTAEEQKERDELEAFLDQWG